MESLKLNHEQTGFFSKILLDYFGENPSLRSFYKYPFNADTVPQIIAEIPKFQRIERDQLADEILYQYDELDIPEKVSKNIELLRNTNTFTVTTAHQLNLFTGPLYYIYKLLNTVRMTEDLSSLYPESNFVPCYWLGSEDHDFEEVNHCFLFNKKIEWTNFQDGSLGTYSTEGIQPLIQEAKDILRAGPFLDELINALERSYTMKTLSQGCEKPGYRTLWQVWNDCGRWQL